MELDIYFKSGNKVTIDKVTEFKVSSGHDGSIHSITVVQEENCETRLHVKSLNLGSVDCIIERKEPEGVIKDGVLSIREIREYLKDYRDLNNK